MLPGMPEASLPNGWTEHTDPNSGQTFYHNASTGETSWSKPAALASPEGLSLGDWTQHSDSASGAGLRPFKLQSITGKL